MKRNLFALMMMVFVVTGCGASIIPTPEPTATPTCAEMSREYVNQMEEFIPRWDDAVSLAGSTPRMSLPPVLSELQALQRESKKFAVPPCAEAKKVNDDFQAATGGVIKGFLLFLNSKTEAEANKEFSTSTENLNNFIDGYAKLRSQVQMLSPLPTPTPGE